jgi:hypothetical protein
MVGRVLARQGVTWPLVARRGTFWPGKARFGCPGKVWLDRTSWGEAWLGLARLSPQGLTWHGMEGPVGAWRVKAGVARRGRARPDMAGRGVD